MIEALLILPSSSVSLPPKPPPTPPHRRRTRWSSTTTTTTHSNKSKNNSNASVTLYPPPPLTSTAKPNSAAGKNLRFYSDLASRLAEDGRFNDFFMILESVVVSGVNAVEFVEALDLKLVSAGIVRVVDEGKLESVVELLESVRKLRIDLLLLLDQAAIESIRKGCLSVVKCGEEEGVVALMETLHGFGLPFRNFVRISEIIGLCVRKANPSVAVRYARIFPHAQILLCNIILEFGKQGDLDSALAVFEASKNDLDSPNMFLYRTIIDVCGLCGDHLRSRSIYKELVAQGVTPNKYVFCSLMNVNAGDLNYTMYLYKKMKTLGVTAEVMSYNILLKSCCLAGRVDLAKNIYKDMKRLESKGKLKLDVFTYCTLVKVFSEAKNWQMALQIKEDMFSAGVAPNLATWSSLISACANAGLVGKAIQSFEEMLQAGCEPDAECCNIIINACVKAVQYNRAFRIFRSWKENGLQKYVHERNAENNVSNCTSSSSQEQFSIKVPFIPTTSTYNTLIKACGSDYSRAKALLDEMKTMGLSPNRVTWSTLIGICGRSEDVMGALKILRSMHVAGTPPDVITYNAAMKICVENKSFDSAFLLFAEMKRFQIEPDIVTYNTLLRARSRYGSLEEVQQCLAVYREMRKDGFRADDYYLKQLIEEWCEGVIQNHHKEKGHPASQNRIAPGPKSRLLDKVSDHHRKKGHRAGPKTLLLDKVAEHLQKSNVESLSIDLRILSKVEARIVVLAVLRMIKETYNPGDMITDDVHIILGGDQVPEAEHVSGVKETVIELLQRDLGLEVASEAPKAETKRNIGKMDRERDVLLLQLGPPMRKPAGLQRLTITKESLSRWLSRRLDALERQPSTYDLRRTNL